MLLQLFIPVFFPQLLLCHILINCQYPFPLVLKTLSQLMNPLLMRMIITIDDYDLNSNLREKKSYYPNDLIRDLGLTKSNAELLTSQLKQWNLHDDSVQITEQHKRNQSFSSFFTMQNAICSYNNVSGLFYSIEISCIPSEWRLFIDSSSKSLKVVLLIMATNIHLFLLLIQSIIKKLTKM